MRHSRSKQTRKLLKFLALNFNLHPPYFLLLDGTFLAECVFNNIPIIDRFKGMFREKVSGDGERGYGGGGGGDDRLSMSGGGGKTGGRKEVIKIMTTRAVIDELKALPKDKFDKVLRFALDECIVIEPREYENVVVTPTSDDAAPTSSSSKNKNVKKHEPLDNAPNSILSYVLSPSPTHPTHLFVCTQYDPLSNILRAKPNCTLLRIHRTVLCMEGLSEATKRKAITRENGKLRSVGVGEKEEATRIKVLRREEKKEEEKGVIVFDDGSKLKVSAKSLAGRSRKKAKGANPLSVKKSVSVAKKSQVNVKGADAGGEEKKRRKRNKTS